MVCTSLLTHATIDSLNSYLLLSAGGFCQWLLTMVHHNGWSQWS